MNCYWKNNDFDKSGALPTSQITLSKRSDNVTFSLLQRGSYA
jgi:hypothetical protein